MSEQNQQIQNGIVFSKYAIVLPASVTVHHMNTGKVESMSAMELVNKARDISQFTQQKNTAVAASLQKLNAAGQWQAVEQANHTSRPGVRSGG